MQTHGGTEADNAITSRERSFSPRLLIDWNRNGNFDHELSDMSRFVSGAETDQTLNGSAPDELTLVEGEAAAELNVTVGGEYDGLNLVAVFSPYNGRSPFYMQGIVGAEVSYAVELHTAYGTVKYQQFRGLLRSTEPDRGKATVEFTCLDRVEALREAIKFPPWAIAQRLSEQGIVRAQLCDSQWVIDHCLRECDTSPTEHRPTYKPELGVGWDGLDGVHFWWSGTGSGLPTQGWLDNSETVAVPDTENGEREMYDPYGAQPSEIQGEGPRPLCINAMPVDTGTAYDDGAESKFWVQDRDLINTHGSHYLGITLISGGTNGDVWKNISYQSVLMVNIGEDVELRIIINAGSAYAEMAYTNTGDIFNTAEFAIDDQHEWQTISAIFDYTSQSGVRCWFNIGGYTGTDGFVDFATSYRTTGPDNPLKGLIKVHRWTKMQDVGYATRNVYNTQVDMSNLRRKAKYQALLDPGKNRFTYMPVDQSGSDAWDLISDVAAAEWASVFWDEEGRFRFWNYDTMLSKQNTTVRTLSLDDVTGLVARNSLDGVRNVFSVEATKKVAGMQRVHSAQDVNEYYVPPTGSDSKKFRVWDRSIMTAYPYKVERHTTIDNHSSTNFPTWNEDVQNGYVVQWYKDDGSGNTTWHEDNSLSSGVDIYAYFDIEGNVVVAIQNGYDYPARLATDGDKAAFSLYGTKILDSDPQLFTKRFDDSINEYGKRNLELSGDWYQDKFQSQGMLDTIAKRTTKPVPVTDNITIAGDPRLQLGDTIEVYDPEGFGERLKAQILGIKRSFDIEKGLTDTLTVELIRPPGEWVLGSSTYSVLGQSTVLS